MQQYKTHTPINNESTSNNAQITNPTKSSINVNRKHRNLAQFNNLQWQINQINRQSTNNNQPVKGINPEHQQATFGPTQNKQTIAKSNQ